MIKIRNLLIIVSVSFILSFASLYIYFDNELINSQKELTNAQELNLNLKEDLKFKSAEIAKLEDGIKSGNEKLKDKEDLISNLNNEIEKINNEVGKLRNELSKYDSLRQLNIVATAYEAMCEPVTINGKNYKGCSGITATGHDVRNTVYKDGYRVVAVDPKLIPLGSILFVETEDRSFVGISEDTGGAIKGNKIDILVNNKANAFSFGKQNATVTVLREGRS